MFSCVKAQSQNLSYPSTQAFTETLEQEMVYTWDFLLNESTVTKFKLSQYWSFPFIFLYCNAVMFSVLATIKKYHFNFVTVYLLTFFLAFYSVITHNCFSRQLKWMHDADSSKSGFCLVLPWCLYLDYSVVLLCWK